MKRRSEFIPLLFIYTDCTYENTLQKVLCYDKMVVLEYDKKITILFFTNYTI